MSYRSGMPVPRRSSASPSASAMYSGSSSGAVGRPRSLGIYGSGSYSSPGSPYGSPSGAYSSGSALYGNSGVVGGYGSSLSPYGAGGSSVYSGTSMYGGSPGKYGSGGSMTSAYGSASASPISLSTYGGTTSGYGGMTLTSLSPYASSSSSGISASSYSGSARNTPSSSYSSSPRNSPRSSAVLPIRSSSFNTKPSRNTHTHSPSSSALSSRSNSCVSLASSTKSGSEGYASGGDWSGNSRVSNSPGAESRPVTPAPSVTSSRSSKEASNENGEIDYKKLYEASVVENERLRDKLKKTEEDLNDSRSQLDKIPIGPMKNSLSEIEKREKRAMERKLSEMEEELKQLQKLKAENEKLKAENRALTRVVSKLTNSANATK